jgi:putative FmdB family regulatory protein
MPTYDYHCESCGHCEEVFQKITDASLTQCPACKKEAYKRGPGGGVGLSFTGTGFYITDYGSKKSDSEPTSSGGGGQCCPCGKNKPCK